MLAHKIVIFFLLEACIVLSSGTSCKEPGLSKPCKTDQDCTNDFKCIASRCLPPGSDLGTGDVIPQKDAWDAVDTAKVLDTRDTADDPGRDMKENRDTHPSLDIASDETGPAEVYTPVCGNNTCDPNENCATCAADCACGQGQACYNAACCTPACAGNDCGDNGCGGKCGTCDQGQACQSGKCVDLVWKDTSTGYEWQVNHAGTYIWQNAIDYCNNLDLDGRGWHLPTISELRSLVQGCPVVPTDGTCGVTDDCPALSCRNNACKGCDDSKGPGPGGVYGPSRLKWQHGWYWSSSSVAGKPNSAWGVNFGNGNVYYGDEGGSLGPARCVRPGL